MKQNTHHVPTPLRAVPTNAASETRGISPVETQLNRLSAIAQDLAEAVSAIENRFQTVIEQSPSLGEAKGDTPRPNLVHGRIGDDCDRLERSVQWLREIEKRALV